MLHAGRGRSWGHHNRKPQGGGTPTPTPSVGNLINVTSWSQAVTLINTTAVSGDVINMAHAGYTDDSSQFLNVSRAMGLGNSITVIFRATQPVAIEVGAQANCNMEFVNALVNPLAIGFSDAQYGAKIWNGTSGVCFSGCNFVGGYTNLYCDSISDFYMRNCNFSLPRNDHINLAKDNTRVKLENFYCADTSHGERMWYKFDGTAPVFQGSDPFSGTGSSLDWNHGDGIQGFGGPNSTLTDIDIDGYNSSIIGQAHQFADVGTGKQLRVRARNSTFSAALSRHFCCDTADNVELSNNTFVLRSDHDPSVSNVDILLLPAGGTGAIRGGLNTIPVGATINVGSSGVDLRAAINGSPVAAPNPPAFLGTTSNVGNLATLRQQKTYTPYSGARLATSDPSIVASGSAPFASGSRFIAWPQTSINGFTYSPWTYGLAWTEWMLDGVGQGPVQGEAGMVFQCNTLGKTVTFRQSFDSTNGVNGTWRTSSNSAVMASAGTTLNPADIDSRMTLSNGNLTGTETAGTSVHSLCRSIGTIPTTDGNYYFEVQPTTGTSVFAMCNSSWSLSADPTNFGVGRACGTQGGTVFYNGGSQGLSPLLTGSDVPDGSRWFGIYIRRSGSGATVKLFMRLPSGVWTTGGGDPTGAGAGHDLSTPFSGQVIYAAAWGQAAGQAMTFNFGGTAFAYAASIGTVTKLA